MPVQVAFSGIGLAVLGLWISLGLFVFGAQIGIRFLVRRYRLALALLSVATFGGFVFSFIAGFSIGRFTALLPLVLTAFAVTYGRAARLQLAAYAAAVAIYVPLAWLIDVQVGFWGIQVELPLCLLAYLLAARFPAGGTRSTSAG